MKTRLTEMVGIKYPIVLSGMSWISVPENGCGGIQCRGAGHFGDRAPECRTNT